MIDLAADERDAVFLWTSEHPFWPRWREAPESDRDRYRKKARRIRQHLADHEGIRS